MEKDIEILEKLVIYWNSLIKEAEEPSLLFKWINTEGVIEKRDALVNLINRVKEYEDEEGDKNENM